MAFALASLRALLPAAPTRRDSLGRASRWLTVLPLCATLVCGPAQPVTAYADNDSAAVQAAPASALSVAIDQVLAEPFLRTAKVGVQVFDLETNQTLYARAPEVPLNPASNVKLVTTAAALAMLGPEYRYPTRLFHDLDARVGTTLRGNIYLQSTGDPSLVTEDMYALAQDLRARGIRKITGGVIVDTSHFDRDELPPGFDQKDELASYRAPSGAVSVNFNTFVLKAEPGAEIGSKVQASIDPPVPSIDLVNEATTDKGHRERLTVTVEPTDKGLKVMLGGSLGEEVGPVGYRYPVNNPANYAGEVMVRVLQQTGIRLGRSRVKFGKRPDDAQVIAAHYSQPLSILIRGVNKFSNNFMAEQILKTLAPGEAPATFEQALERVRAFLKGIGVEANKSRYGNGSGLYDTNRFSAQQFVELLALMYHDFRFSADYLASFAVMGVDGSTRSRLAKSEAKGWVRAKTGTLNGVSALSGYAGAPKRAPIVFAILFNDLGTADAFRARVVQNRIAELLASYAAGRPLQGETLLAGETTAE